ncbi:glycosyl transferase, group 1 [Sphaerospermopsis reniformis]|uniref:Glycosyl transferase, group 1 n=1 Tax=Sphaerospermopsis reniformis TaxID=531300 RepID=A0A479ZZI9_9CYAN|nr:FkbM family methyltransferase [Sphaerospermopsis reniformis]GCL36873.1 glycosyl transferase, group 1 [Sphaerospermopsis reniformis]
MNNQTKNSELNHLIPPEIKNDEFYTAIQEIARKEEIKTVLEIGSSSGAGSTEAFVTGMRQNHNRPILFCMEVSEPRFNELKKRYENEDFVRFYNISSVPIESFPDEQEVINFYEKTNNNLKFYPLDRVLNWLHQDIEYVKESGFSENGIRKIKNENNIDYFDIVLIDGSEFTGGAELEEIYGAKYIFLDDITTFKNYENHNRLLSDKNYELISQNNSLRNGYSIFKKIESIDKYFSVHESAEQTLVSKLVKPGMVVFDIGANIGDYSILLSKLVGCTGKIYSFEPTSSIYQKLKNRLLEFKCDNVCLVNKAVFSHNTQIEFNEFPEEFSAWNSIGTPQMLDPCGSGTYVPIVNTELVEAITLDSFCHNNNIDIIDYLKIDVEGAESDVLQGASELLRNQKIRFIQFEISQKMLEGLNRTAKTTFDILIANGYECHRITANGSIGENAKDSSSFYENYIAFPTLPIHFFTIVLNGQPFIRYHIEVFKKLPFKWHWHIIEGVADLKHDTSWSLKLGGHITDEIHKNGRSCDGTTEYIDELVQLYPENITVYRKPEGIFWDGKREMVNAPLANIKEESLLWQVDVDELWTLEQICTAREMFISNADKTAAFYWCWYFVGEKLIISTRNCYTQNPQQDWLRTWRFKPGYIWAAHEPPVLVKTLADGQYKNVATANPFLHQETEADGLVFQHFAYVTPEQLNFKEKYYGYKNAVSQWNALQANTKFPILLRDYFSWVQDTTQVDIAHRRGIIPLAQRNNSNNNWRFLQQEEVQQQITQISKPSPIIIVDGVFFQYYQTGIARVWKSLLQEWANNEFAQHIIILDRDATAPKIAGIRYRTIPQYDYRNTETDKQMLQQICNEEGAELFISSYYTTPITKPSVFMAYDMIPEVLGANLNEPMWREKHHAIKHASAYIAISQNTARDLSRYFPNIAVESITVAHCGVSNTFSPANPLQINTFKHRYGINKPYFLLAGNLADYKNQILFLKAFSKLPNSYEFDIIFTGFGGVFPPELRDYTSGSAVHQLRLSDEELAIAYSGAVALVYPSKYEGFGMPIVEAMACGCPVITCHNSSMPEVAGEAAIYVKENDVDAMANALISVQNHNLRASLITAGLAQAQKFSWTKMADKVSSALINATLLSLKLRDINLIIFPDPTQPEQSIYQDLVNVITALEDHPHSDNITLLINASNFPSQFTQAFMDNLCTQDEEETAGLEISLVGKLSPMQWESLLPQLSARIVLTQEDQQTLEQLPINQLQSCEVESLNYQLSILLTESLKQNLRLRDINLIIFPEPTQSEQSIYQDLINVITALEEHPDSDNITLLINASNFPSQFTQAFMDNLCNQDEEETAGLEISLVGKLSPMQWESLLPQLSARIVLNNEDQQALEQVQLENLTSYQLDNLDNQQF